eukprot:6208681-Pleurochrysis_carterae.AAC.1
MAGSMSSFRAVGLLRPPFSRLHGRDASSLGLDTVLATRLGRKGQCSLGIRVVLARHRLAGEGAGLKFCSDAGAR